MKVGSPVFLCSYTVARGGGHASPEKNWQNGAIWAYQKYVITGLKTNKFKDYKWTTNLFDTIFS